jgi:methylenetetrahydrofolate dehydrogenase (NADP+)/methenyltetrahydrofolate cyclohydrolase
MTILDGKKIRDEILTKVKKEVASLSFTPIFCDVLVGNDPASFQYVQMKKKNAEMVGIEFHSANFPETITTPDLIKEIKILNEMKNMCGIIVQLPLPSHLDRQMILDSIDPALDVDCLGTTRSEKFYQNYGGERDLGFPAAVSCMVLLDSLNLDLKNPHQDGASKKIVVLGQGNLVGKPVVALLKLRGLSPTIITSKTPARNAFSIADAGGENKEELIKEADVIISGMGQGKYITGEMIKEGAVLIDAGTSEDNGSIVGDVDLNSVKDVAGYVSPVPGGVGPVTVAMLLRNVLIVAKNRRIFKSSLTPTPLQSTGEGNKVFYITGMSGTGKSTVVEKLAEKGIFPIDADSIKGLTYWIDKETKEKTEWHPGMSKEWYSKHQYVCDKEKLVNLIKNSPKGIVVVAGLFNNRSELRDLFDKVFLLQCKEETFLKRIIERENHNFGKHPLEQENILSWYKNFEREVLEEGAIPINTEHPLKEVVEEIYKYIELVNKKLP